MAEKSTLYSNGSFFTMDPTTPKAEALLSSDDRIQAIGSLEDVQRSTRPDTQRVDLDGGTVFPGFNDCHCHILSFGQALQQLDVSRDAVRNIPDVLRAVASRAQTAPQGQWVIGRGYDQNCLAEARDVTRQDLDPVSPQHPVVLWHTSGHGLACNSQALRLAGINPNTSTPSGGEIDRDESGQPKGVLKEAPATDLLAAVIPPPSISQGAEAILAAMEVMASEGITSATDAATGQGDSIEPALRMYRAALDSGRLKGRVTLMPQGTYVAPPATDDILSPAEFEVFQRRGWLEIGATKIFSDGALTTRTAALRRPFLDSADNRGLLIWEPEVLASMILRAHKAGWQIGTHAIGDRAVELVANCYQRALQAAPRQDHRHRIEHCMLLDDELATCIARLQLVPTIQPGFMSRLGDAYITGLGMERASQLMPLQLFEKSGIHVGFSSDRPVIPGQPLEGIRAAISRTTQKGVVLGRHHSVTAEKAIRHYTVGSSFAGHQEKDRGTLTAGKLADFVVLSQNPYETSLDEWDDVKVMMTVVGGERVFQNS